MCAQLLSHIQVFATPWTVAHQAPLSMGFSKQKYWSGWPLPSPEDLPNPEIEPTFLVSPALAGRFFITSATCEATHTHTHTYIYIAICSNMDVLGLCRWC